MKERIIFALRARKNRTISLGELEKMVPGDTDYEDFAAQLLELVAGGVLQPVKAHGLSPKNRRLANSYRIVKPALSRSVVDETDKYQFLLHPRLDLAGYYSLEPLEWKKDLPYIERVDDFLRRSGLPDGEATAPEWSYRLVGDEKWIESGRGRLILQRLGLWNQLKIVSRPDPLMLAINPRAWKEALNINLVIENKSPFHVLMDALPGTPWLSIIYGAGWKATADLPLLEKQLGREHEPLRVYYFGDLDYEGISIWHALNGKRRVEPALNFYRALLDKSAARGKEGQRCNRAALEHFTGFFSPGERQRIVDVLAEGAYYPQEVLSREELTLLGRKCP